MRVSVNTVYCVNVCMCVSRLDQPEEGARAFKPLRISPGDQLPGDPILVVFGLYKPLLPVSHESFLSEQTKVSSQRITLCHDSLKRIDFCLLFCQFPL